MKILVLIFGFALSTSQVFAQDSIPKNSIIVETNVILCGVLSYDRIIPMSQKARLMVGADYIMGLGFGWGAHGIAPEFGVMAFGPKHFMETGFQFVFDISKQSKDAEEEGGFTSPGIRLAYRFQSNKGFIFRATANAYFNIDPIFIPTIGFGYSF